LRGILLSWSDVQSARKEDLKHTYIFYRETIGMTSNLIDLRVNVKRLSKTVSDILENHMARPCRKEKSQLESEKDRLDLMIHHGDSAFRHLDNLGTFFSADERKWLDDIQEKLIIHLSLWDTELDEIKEDLLR
jgi:hypothetical protein